MGERGWEDDSNALCLASIRRAQATKKKGLVIGFHGDFAGDNAHFVQLAFDSTLSAVKSV